MRVSLWVYFAVLLGITNFPYLCHLAELPPAAYILLSPVAVLAFLWINVKPTWNKRFDRFQAMFDGRELLILFLMVFCVDLWVSIRTGITVFSGGQGYGWWITNLIVSILGILVLAWNGLVRIFVTSGQVGITRRIVLLLLWWMPIVNLVLVFQICRIVRLEYEMETDKMELNAVRQESELCRTKYPLLLVHGVFFRDMKYFNYWGRIPKELKKNGAVLFYGNQQSAASVEKSAEELKARMLQVLEETGAEKLNVIAHSKGGLDTRYAISRLGAAPYVASLTTINTPHRGCGFADYLLQKLPAGFRNFLAKKYNSALRKFGDKDPDFLGAVQDLTASRCAELNQLMPDSEKVFYQSTASCMKNFFSAPFPLNFSHGFVKHFDRENDGLVSLEAAKWGSRCRVLTPPGRKGISHGDMIDLFRKNLKGFDVREFYVDLVSDLKKQGF
ncbi:Lipase precursor [uncultured Ruminococcus sp.]|uniref:Triacylglycerol lipase n=1 Tax=Massiliimalia timonensis TaxID=1987501 RepID=A0A8J6TW11_9FIRM|nr:triacylglycerol lipase [Massiliimalia timonensis]MBC8611953.1 triacylglycerol lipase [Massiliimalia timonensis]SCG95574.1 Lipase precursor [uncultured Clostridium sp.]SCH91541.1 Lipase precursor [uncultured Ruminococcus sp.]